MLNPNINYVSYADLLGAIRKNLSLIPRDVEIVVGVPRSGMIPAYAIALYLNLPVMDLPSFVENRCSVHGITRKLRSENKEPSLARHILLIDDSYCSGVSLEASIETVRNFGFTGTITTVAAIITPSARKKVDISFLSVDMPRVFEWNIFHHDILKNACLDLDGVLCVDPTEEENDDGKRYEVFLRTAVPLYLPTQEVGHIVTSRLTKYQKETELWLKNNGVKYKHLHMLDLPSKEERIRTQSHHKHKIYFYKNTGAELFIESDLRQAALIATETGKPVFCTETVEMVRGEGLHASAIIGKLGQHKKSLAGILHKTVGKRLSPQTKKILKKILKKERR